MSKSVFFLFVASLVFLFSACSPERYALSLINGKTYLETKDRTGQLVYFLVDTGSNRSYLSAAWVKRAGGRLEAGPPDAWYGINLGDSGHQVARGCPSLPGVPTLLEGLSAMDGGRSSPLSDSLAVVGLFGTDLLWDWSIDFRGEVAYLVHGSLEEPADIRYDIFQEGPHYTVPIQWTLDPSDEASPSVGPSRAVIDTGCPVPVVYFHSTTLDGLDRVINAGSMLSANGTPTTLLRAKGFRVGTFLVPPVTVMAGKLDSGSMALIGTPALWSSKAVLNLKKWTLSFSQTLRPLPVSQNSPEAWAWKAAYVPGQGIRIDAVVPGSTLDRRGLHPGDIIPWVGQERADQLRSVLEWKRAWIAFAVQDS